MLIIINQAKEYIVAKEVTLHKNLDLVKEIIINLANNMGNRLMDNTSLAKDSIYLDMDNIFLGKANIFQAKLVKDNTYQGKDNTYQDKDNIFLVKDYMLLQELHQDKARDNILLKSLMLLNMQVLMLNKEGLAVALGIILMIGQIFLDQKSTNLNKKTESWEI